MKYLSTLALSLILLGTLVSAPDIPAFANSKVVFGEMRDHANVRIEGKAAEQIFVAMNQVLETTTSIGHLLIVTRQGVNISCQSTFEFSETYRDTLDIASAQNVTFTCSFGVTPRGEVIQDQVR